MEQGEELVARVLSADTCKSKKNVRTITLIGGTKQQQQREEAEISVQEERHMRVLTMGDAAEEDKVDANAALLGLDGAPHVLVLAADLHLHLNSDQSQATTSRLGLKRNQ